jgi:hypothetical protein
MPENPTPLFPYEGTPPNISFPDTTGLGRNQEQFNASPAAEQIDAHIRDFADTMASVISPKGGKDVKDLFFDPRRPMHIVEGYPQETGLSAEEHIQLAAQGWIAVSHQLDQGTMTDSGEIVDSSMGDLIDILATTDLHLGLSSLQSPFEKYNLMLRSLGVDDDTAPTYQVPPRYMLRIRTILPRFHNPIEGLNKTPPPRPVDYWPTPETEEPPFDDIPVDYSDPTPGEVGLLASLRTDGTVPIDVSFLRLPDTPEAAVIAQLYAYGVRIVVDSTDYEVDDIEQELPPLPPRSDDITWIQVEPPKMVAPADINAVQDMVLNGIPGPAAALLIGGEARIHFKPEDALTVLKAAPGLLGDSIEAIEQWYTKALAYVDTLAPGSPQELACCLVQVLSAFVAARDRDKNIEANLDTSHAAAETAEVIATIEKITGDLTLIIEAVIQLSAAPSAGFMQLWSVLLNLAALIHDAMLMAVSAATMALWQAIGMKILLTLRRWYQEANDKGPGSRALMATARCFALDQMFLGLVGQFSEWGKGKLLEISSRLKYSGATTALMQLNEQVPVANPNLIYLRGLLMVLRKINIAVSQGELCFNRGFTDISSNRNRGYQGDGANDGSGYGGLNLGKGSDSDKDSDGMGSLFKSPTADDVSATDLTGAAGGSNPSLISGNQNTNSQSFGISGPTDVEMVNFFVKYFSMSPTEARTTIRQQDTSRKCRDKLTAQEAGQLGSILAQVGLEL